MPRIPFSDLPGDARLWVFPADRPLQEWEEERFLSRVDAFLDQWNAHGSPLEAGREWLFGRFLLVGVDESNAPPSGCSIDAMARVLKESGAELGVNFLDHGSVWFRQDGAVRRATRSEFQALADAGEVDSDTPVFDHSVTRLSSLSEGEWEKPAGASWHRRVFFSKNPA